MKPFKQFSMYEDNRPVTAGDETITIVQIVEMTDEEKVEMYMKCSKKELIEMLIQCNKILDNR